MYIYFEVGVTTLANVNAHFIIKQSSFFTLCCLIFPARCFFACRVLTLGEFLVFISFLWELPLGELPEMLRGFTAKGVTLVT